MSDLKSIIEALIYASPEPVSLKALGKLLESEPQEDIDAAIVGLKTDYERPGGLQLIEVAGGFQIVTKPEFHEWVRRLFHERTTQKLSVAALETLAVIAYRQPVTVPEIGDIRGVNAAGVISTLVDRKLIKIVGRKAVVGRPFMYGTTREFLERFGLNDITDLPKVEDMSELLGFDLPAGVGDPTPQSALPFDFAGGDDQAAGEQAEGGDTTAEVSEAVDETAADDASGEVTEVVEVSETTVEIVDVSTEPADAVADGHTAGGASDEDGEQVH